jgi:hypothetical protein
MDHTCSFVYQAAISKCPKEKPFLTGGRVKELQGEYEMEQDPDRKRKILDQMLALIQEDWEQFFTSLSEKEDPRQFLLFVADINRVFDGRRAQLKEKEKK